MILAGPSAAFFGIPAGRFARLKTPSGDCIALLIDAIDVWALDGRQALLALTDPEEPVAVTGIAVCRSHEPEDLGTFESYLGQGEHREIYARLIEKYERSPPLFADRSLHRVDEGPRRTPGP
jgi:hypothetical protein